MFWNYVILLFVIFVLCVDFVAPFVRMEKTGEFDWFEALIRMAVIFGFLNCVFKF